MRFSRPIMFSTLCAALCGSIFLFGGCSERPAGGTVAQEEAEQPPAVPPGVVEIPLTVRNNLGITFATVERRQVTDTLRVPGSFEIHPLARHEYRLMMPGRVEYLVDQYDQVEPGQVLYRFVSPQWPELQHEILEAEQAIAAAEAEIGVAEATRREAEAELAANRERAETLASAEVRRAELATRVLEMEAALPRLAAQVQLAETRLDNARSQYRHAIHRASVATGIAEDALTQTIEHDGEQAPRYRIIEAIEVRATEPGIVETIAATNGAYVEPPGLVLSTIDPSRLRFRATALQSDLPRIDPDAPARIVPPMRSGVDVNASTSAELTIGLEAHPDQRTVALLAEPTEPIAWARPGISAFLEIVTASSDGPRLAIPASAVVRDGITHVFFRRDPQNPNRAVRVEADLGPSDGRWIVINSGVRLGDEVVLDGVYEMKLATAASGTQQEGGHFHGDGSFHVED